MGIKNKEIKAMLVGLLTQRFMDDVLKEMTALEEPTRIQWVKDNFKMIVMNRVNIVMDFVDKRRLSADEFDSLGKATEIAQMGYDAYLVAKERRRKEKEEKKVQGEEVQKIQ